MTEVLPRRTPTITPLEIPLSEQFFVHNTKRALKWLSTNPGQTPRSTVDIYLIALIPDEAQRKVIINVLCSNGMVEEVGGTINVTSEGASFLQWMEMSGETL